MGTWVTVIGWVIALALGAAALSSLARVRGSWRDAGAWAVPLPFACLSVIALTVLGVLGALTGGALAALIAAAEGIFLWRGDDKPHYALAGHLGAGFRHLYADARMLADRARPGEPAGTARPAPAPPAGPPPVPAQAPEAGTREVPALRDDPALGPPPGPAQIAERVIEGTVVVPGPWAELAAWITGYQPEDDNDQSMFIHGHAAGLIAVMEALNAHAETVVNEIGLDPSYGLAVLEFALEIAGAAGAGALTDARYHVIYGGVKEAVDNGLILPHNARQWFGGAPGAAPQDGPSESAA